MANPRRTTTLRSIPTNPSLTSDQNPSPAFTSLLSSLTLFLKRPRAFPFLLSIFVLLTWVSLRFQQNPRFASFAIRKTPPFSGLTTAGRQGALEGDVGANLVRFSSVEFPSKIFRDKRGWLLNPVAAALGAGISGGAQFCVSVHVGEIRSGGVRGNHRHHTCNETFIIWGAETKFRLENRSVEGKGYSEVMVGVDEVAVAASPSGTAHALINVDPVRTTLFLGCQDCIPNYNTSATDFKTWNDL